MAETRSPVAWLQITVETPKASLAEAVFESFDAEAVTVLDAGDDITSGQPLDTGLFTNADWCSTTLMRLLC